MLHASCHCGAVNIDLDFEPETITQCTCSICRRYAARWAYGDRSNIRVHCEPDTISKYLWGDKTLEFCFCMNCGCLTHYESVEKKSDSRIAVNSRMMQPEDVADIRVRTFDGADSWKYID